MKIHRYPDDSSVVIKNKFIAVVEGGSLMTEK
jgi:hypothetical protein